MHIERIQVDDGFLDGLDLSLSPGLNVVIGARGSGKTSLVELIRFCLGAPFITRDAKERGFQQALSVLQGGQITITLSDGSDRIQFIRSAADRGPRSTGPVPDTTVLAQGEIEAVGYQASGRLYLIDRLRPERTASERRSDHLTAEIASLTIEIRDLHLEIDDMEETLLEYQGVAQELQQALTLQESALESAKATSTDRDQLARLQVVSSQIKVRSDVYGRSLDELTSLDRALARLEAGAVLAETWPESAGDTDTLSPIRERLENSLKRIAAIRSDISEAVQGVETLRQQDVHQAIAIDNSARAIRVRLDQVDRGVGDITRRVGELQERAGQVSALRQRLRETRQRATSRASTRDDLYRTLDALREERFSLRQGIAASLSSDLSPSISVRVTRSAQTQDYVTAIIEGLRGSGLHYNRLSPHLARSMPPIELVQAVEDRDPRAIAAGLDISEQRAGSIIQALKQSDLARIITAPIEDGATLSLLDGSVFKTSQEVSIGQRCTIVLPVLLGRHGGILIIDQPEDHLDNSFIATTVVTALRSRHASDQLILASHNANIPVLGDADLIVALKSDGKRGFVSHTGPLLADESVRSITDIMEGGYEAFRRRATFYGLHSEVG